jgi:hypothetical protein
MSVVTLYHGTDSKSAADIMENGLNARSCLTSSLEVADYFGEARIEELQDLGELTDCIGQVILAVNLPVDRLVVDYPAYEEPISIYRNVHTTCDREWHDGCDNGDIPYPKDELDVLPALEATTCVRVSGKICGKLFSINE